MKKMYFFILIFFLSNACADNVNPDAARTNAKLGLAYLEKGLYPQSKQSLLIALREDRKIASVWYGMGYYLEKTNHLRSAQAYYQQAIKVDPHSGAAKNNYGIFLCDQHRYQGAIAEFKLAANEPSYLNAGRAYKNAGNCAMRIPNKKLAMRYFREAQYDDV